MLIHTNESKDILKKFEKLWSKIGDHIRSTVQIKSDNYNKNYMKIKSNSDRDLPLKKARTL